MSYLNCMQFSRYIVFSGMIRHLSVPFILYRKGPGSRLLSHTVSSIVPSAVWVLTIVFGMGTGVSPRRIATRKGSYQVFLGN